MNAFQTNELQDIWGRVKDWPEELQVSLASKILSSLQHEPAAPRKPLGRSGGHVWASNTPPPTDEEVRRILDEPERTRKFG